MFSPTQVTYMLISTSRRHGEGDKAALRRTFKEILDWPTISLADKWRRDA